MSAGKLAPLHSDEFRLFRLSFVRHDIAMHRLMRHCECTDETINKLFTKTFRRFQNVRAGRRQPLAEQSEMKHVRCVCVQMANVRHHMKNGMNCAFHSLNK